ncbi:hypothetical protein BEP19_16795 [Ammoniphilus oxalaticus]|uniref:Uncharacterized protein n=1 Tax=Ammoniphilus oxalaticus TaxID=66863 RepID=A0A419SQ72_9BACL|nr:hypothetical protein [Ammoniphilus oxalaticus]RKD26495.1 hypothetical protein BEP19_16795 [Ammoniphilus oxalaticus]
MREQMELLDRYITANQALLEQGETLYVQANDGIIILRNEVNEAGESRTTTYFSEFDGTLNLSVKEVIQALEGGES